MNPRITSYGTKGTELAATITHRTYRPDGTKRAVIACHGLNGRAWHPVNFPDSTLDEMANRGYPVISPDLGGTSTWGNDAAQAKVADALAWMQANMGAKAGGALLLTGSMGTLAALNFMRNNPTLVAAVAGRLPAVDLADLHDNAAARGIIDNSTINAAYVDAAGYTAALPTHNPAQTAGSFAALKTRIKLWYSDDDPTVIPTVVQAFAAGSGVSAISMGNQGGHVFGNGYTPAICDWLESFN